MHSPNYIPLHFSIDYLQYYIINRNCDIHLLLHLKVECIEIEYELTIKEEELVEAIKHCQPYFIYNKVEKYCDILEHLINEIEDLEIIFDLDTNHMITQYYK